MMHASLPFGEPVPLRLTQQTPGQSAETAIRASRVSVLSDILSQIYELEVFASLRPGLHPVAETCRLRFSASGIELGFYVPWRLVRGAVMRQGGRAALKSLSDPLTAAHTIDVAFDRLLTGVESKAMSHTTCVGVSDPPDQSLVEGIAFQLESLTVSTRLICDTPRALAEIFKRSRPNRIGTAKDRIPVFPSLEIGCCRIPVADLRGLKVQDVILPQRAIHPNQGLLCLQGWCAPVRIEAGQLVVEETWSMEQLSEISTEDEADLSLPTGMIEDITVTLRIEVARVGLTINELDRLGPGQLIDLPDLSLDDVALLANGRRIARGALVQIGDTVAVQIVRLCDHG